MKLFLKILLIVLWIGLAAGSVVLMGFANSNHEVKSCTGIDVLVNYSGSEPLLSPSDLKHQLTAAFGKIEKKTLKQIDIESILTFLRRNPCLEYADAHTTIEGRLVVEVRQCRPIVRIISSEGINFYLDTKGKLLPVNPEYPVRVIIANGNIEIPLKPGKSIFPKGKKKQQPSESIQILQNIHSIAQQLRADSVLNALVEQVYVKPDGEMQLATKAGSHIIEFGDTSNSADKLENLKTFYKYGLSKTGWNTYSIINLKFKNQVVCTK